MHTYARIRRASRCIYISCSNIEVCRECVCVCGFLSTWVFTSPLGVKSVLNYWTGDVEYMKKNSIRRASKVAYFNVILTSILHYYYYNHLVPCPAYEQRPTLASPRSIIRRVTYLYSILLLLWTCIYPLRLQPGNFRFVIIIDFPSNIWIFITFTVKHKNEITLVLFPIIQVDVIWGTLFFVHLTKTPLFTTILNACFTS